MSVEPCCDYCGEELCEFGLTEEDAIKTADGRLYCCEDCMAEDRNERWEARFCSPDFPPGYND